ncbi:SWI5-dependent HO expression protein 4 [Coemansia sp. RSA 1358]|nr:SWI5-dependent HO expression protein 4 [Coemansia sp. RSA 1358]
MTKMQIEGTIEHITKELQANNSAAPMLLLKRAQLYADMGDETNAKADIANAAALVKEPQYKSDEAVAAVERAFHETSISPAILLTNTASGASVNKYAGLSDQEIVLAIEQKVECCKFDQYVVSVACELTTRADASGKSRLPKSLLLSIINAFHNTCEYSDNAAVSSTSEHSEELKKQLAQCVRSVALRMTAESSTGKDGSSRDIKDIDNRTVLEALVDCIVNTWCTQDANGHFKQMACQYGAAMYTAIAYALSTHLHGSSSEVAASNTSLYAIYSFFIQQVWLVGTLPVATADEIKDVCQGILRLLTANKPLFLYLFISSSASSKQKSKAKSSASPIERLLRMLGVAATNTSSESKHRSLALLVANQLVGAAKVPNNSSMFAEPSTIHPSRSGSSSGITAKPELTGAMTQLRSIVVSLVDSWIQSTVQNERSHGLLAAAALYEGGVGSDLLSDLWLKKGWVEDLWDQGEFDKPETQLSLLNFADACSTDVTVGKQMKEAGNGLVQELARKGKTASLKNSTNIDTEIEVAASVVLAKWSGVSTAAPASAGASGNAKSNEAASDTHGVSRNTKTEDADPVDLANIHIDRISSAINKCGTNVSSITEAAAIEKAVEALGFLCLKPKIKEHVAPKEEFLRLLFGFVQKASVSSLKFGAIMLIRNLTIHKPVLSEEEKRMQQLKHLGNKAQSGGDADKRTVGDGLKQEDETENEDSKFDSLEFVTKRSIAVCKAGAVSVLVSSVQSTMNHSDRIKDAVAEVMVCLATAQALRGLIVQQGGVRALLRILTSDAPKAVVSKPTSSQSFSQAKDDYVPKALHQKRDKNIAFSLAKIAISVPPNLAFQDPREIVLLLLSLLVEETETQTLLMKFEALLALTNLASVEPNSAYDVRRYMALKLNGISSIEMLMLSDHPLVRRAATELLCNLVYDPEVFERYVNNADKHASKLSLEETVPGKQQPLGIVELPNDDENSEDSKDNDAYRSHRLHLLVALADVDDSATRSAAAGALAILSNDPRCCRYLFLAHPRASDVLLGLVNEDGSEDGQNMLVAFKHRVAVILANSANCSDTKVLSRLQSRKDFADILKAMTADPSMPYYIAAKSALDKISER